LGNARFFDGALWPASGIISLPRWAGNEDWLMTSTKSVEQRMVANAKKAFREQEALKALREYQTEKTRIDANTLRLRALRLAKEAADAQAAAAEPAPAKKAPKRQSKSTAS
jgi:hypothetical protein